MAYAFLWQFVDLRFTTNPAGLHVEEKSQVKLIHAKYGRRTSNHTHSVFAINRGILRMSSVVYILNRYETAPSSELDIPDIWISGNLVSIQFPLLAFSASDIIALHHLCVVEPPLYSQEDKQNNAFVIYLF